MKRYMATTSVFAVTAAVSMGAYVAAQSSTTGTTRSPRAQAPSSTDQIPCTPVNGSTNGGTNTTSGGNSNATSGSTSTSGSNTNSGSGSTSGRTSAGTGSE